MSIVEKKIRKQKQYSIHRTTFNETENNIKRKIKTTKNYYKTNFLDAFYS